MLGCIAAMLMGFYSLSSLLLVRSSLPAKYRQVISAAVGELEVAFYHHWFDAIFLSAALCTLTLLAVREGLWNSRLRRSQVDLLQGGQLQRHAALAASERQRALGRMSATPTARAHSGGRAAAYTSPAKAFPMPSGGFSSPLPPTATPQSHQPPPPPAPFSSPAVSSSVDGGASAGGAALRRRRRATEAPASATGGGGARTGNGTGGTGAGGIGAGSGTSGGSSGTRQSPEVGGGLSGELDDAGALEEWAEGLAHQEASQRATAEIAAASAAAARGPEALLDFLAQVE
tara:strand:- start:2995 stop:3858 length:864 start_codon:yes stop_codon:yes gene_type:complete